MFQVNISSYRLLVHRGPLPSIYSEYRRRAALAEEFAMEDSDGEACFVALTAESQWPSLLVAQRFGPYVEGFAPGVLLVPETKVLFIGAGTRVLAYDVGGPRRLWEDTADTGFWGWAQHGQRVVMAAELELAAWDVHGTKLWTTFVEPPWTYEVIDDQIRLNVMGRQSAFPLDSGPAGQ